MEAIVRFESVSKIYGSHKAVDGLNLAIEPGRFVTLLGPSGCGKSTTLRMLGGFEMPTSGRIVLDGKDVTHQPPNRRDVNIVFQDYALFPHMSVGRNIAFGMEMQGRPSEIISKRVQSLLDLVHLSDFFNRSPSELSGGQRQRVALMRAIAPDPKVLLLDEPLSALDARLRQQMQIELKSIQKKTGRTFLFVTHDQEEAVTLSDTIVVMNEGRVEQVGEPKRLYQRPRNRFVAEFVGETNLLACKVIAVEGGQVTARWNDVLIKADANGNTFVAGQTANIVVRPESIRCSLVPGGGENTVLGKIVQRVFKGNHTALVIETVTSARLKILMDAAAVSDLAGDQVWLSWHAQNAVALSD